MHEENHTLYLTVVDGRVHNSEDIEDFTVTVVKGHPIRIKDFARVERGPEPVFNLVIADSKEAILLNIRSQPDGSTLEIARPETGIFLRPVVDRTRIGQECVAGDYFRAVSFSYCTVSFPQRLGDDLCSDAGDPGNGSDYVDRGKSDGTEL
jgi:hypothetical protein